MDKQTVQEAINTLLNNIHKEEKTYSEALTRDEILATRKAIRIKIRELNQELIELYKSLEELEKDSL